MRVGVVGGGILGLTVAYGLAKEGHAVTLYERDSVLGGLAGCFEIRGESLEKFFHHIGQGDKDMIELVREVGLEDSLTWRNSKFGFYYVNKIYRFGSPLDILRFKPLTFIERIKMGWGVVKIRRIEDWRPLDRCTAKEFISRTMGEKAYRVVWQPLFQSRFGEEYEGQVSASWLWSKITDGKKPGVRAVDKSIGYFQGGFGKFFLRLADLIVEKGGRVLPGMPVLKIEVGEGRVRGLIGPGGFESFDGVVTTVPTPVFVDLVSPLPGAYRQNLQQFEYLGVVCLVLMLKKPLTQSYWVTMNDPTFPFVGIIEHTNLDSRKTIHGQHVVYIPKYTRLSSPYYQCSKEELLETYLPYINKIFPAFDKSWVSETYLWKESYAQPVPTVNYASRIPPFETPIQNLYLATMAQIYPEDRGMNNGVRLAKRLVEVISKKSVPKKLTDPIIKV